MKTQWVKGLRPGLEVASHFGVYELSLAKTKNGVKYLRVVLGDRTGMIEARVWDPGLAEEASRKITQGDVAVIGGMVVEFNGPQVNIETILKADRVQVDINDYRLCTEQDIALMLARFTEITGQVNGRWLQALLAAAFTPEKLQQFSQAAAARVIHHAYSGGLLEHTLEVLEYCLKILDVQGGLLNREVLLTGAALHDIGKLWEYEQDGLTFQRTDTGRLLGGHVILGRDHLRQLISSLDGFPNNLALHLEHLILSHHGQREWGAAEEPRTIEAIALHQADLISARLNQASNVVRSQQGSDPWTSYDRHLGRSLFIPDKASPRQHREPPGDPGSEP